MTTIDDAGERPARRTPRPTTCARRSSTPGVVHLTPRRRRLPPLVGLGAGAARRRAATSRRSASTTRAPQRWFPPIMPREEFLLTDYVRSFPDLVGSIDVFTGGDKEHRALLDGARGGRRLDRAPRRRPRWCCRRRSATRSTAPCPHDIPADGLRRGVLRLVVPPRAEPRPGPDADLPDLRVRARSGRRSRRSRTATSGCERGLAALTALGLPVRSEAANDPFFGRVGRMLAANQLDLGAEVRDGASTSPRSSPPRSGPRNYHEDHFGHAFGLHLADGDDRAQRLLRLRAGPDHAGPVRHPRHGRRGLARRRCGPRCSADRAMADAADVDGTEHTQVWFGPESASALRLGLPPGRRRWPAAARSSARRWGRRGAPRTARSGGSPRSWPGPGIVALRFDYDGTGDSAGLQDDPDRVAGLARQHRGGPAVPPRPRRARRRRRSACGSAPPWPRARPPAVDAVPLAGLLGPVPERPHLPARGRGALRLRGDAARGARRRAAAHPGLPVRRGDGRGDARRSTSASSRPTGRSPTGCCC